MKAKRILLEKLENHPIGSRLVYNRSCRSVCLAVVGLIGNLLYGFYNGALGLLNRSLWFGASCFYYLLMGTMRFLVVLSSKNRSRKGQYALLGRVGALFTLLSLVLMVIIYISLAQDRAARYGTITMITIATYTFTKITFAAVKALKYRGKNAPLLTVIQNISFGEAAVSLLTMQQSMLVSFGGMGQAGTTLLNALTGAGVCMFTLFLGVTMMKNARKGRKNDKKQ